MCGIVGYVGRRNAQEVLLQGLEKLEYRGYDSSGIAVVQDGNIELRKFKGRLSVLSDYLMEHPLNSSIGIGHTRWATHGAPSDKNAHPHMNQGGTIAVIHNGIIENYMDIKKSLMEKGYVFVSDTDTEVIAHTIDSLYHGDLLDAVNQARKIFRGAYAIVVAAADKPDELVAVRMESPMVVGLGEGENFIASDIPALLEYTNKVYFLENGETVHLKKDEITIYNDEWIPQDKKVFTVDWDIASASKGGYSHYTLKEILEQPEGIKNTLMRRLDESGNIVLDQVSLTKEDMDKIRKVYIVGCGTAYHAGQVGRFAIEKFAHIPVETDIASEFRYNDSFVDENTLLIVISQSGETADTLAAVRDARKKGARVLAVTNVVGSSVARESQDVFYTWAGPEIGVCSTKAYTTQLTALYMIALNMALVKGALSQEEYHEKINSLKEIPEKAAMILKDLESYKNLSEKILDATSVFYIGRGLDYKTAMEAALKLKEISYIHTEAFPAGELKHGTIALIEEGTPVLSVITQESLFEKSISNVMEVKARGAYTIGILCEKFKNENITPFDDIIYIPNTDSDFAAILSTIPTQLIAYYTAVLKGNDVDKPRNLAKSVTVE